MKSIFSSQLLLSLAVVATFGLAVGSNVHAQDDASAPAATATPKPKKAKSKKKKAEAPAATPTPGPVPAVSNPPASKEVTPLLEAKKAGDIDDEITNARLRATTGKKSPFSFWSQFIYNGAALTSPGSTSRPQLNSQNNADPTSLAGQVSGKYRITEHDSVLAGIGIQYVPSYTSNSGTPQAAQTVGYNPYVDYNRAFRSMGVQHVVDVTLTKYTLADDLTSNLNWNWGADDQVMWEVGAAKKLSLGGVLSVDQDVYTSAGQSAHSIYLQYALEPIAEYALSDMISLRTVFRMYIMNQVYGDKSWVRGDQTESIGVGFAITRDIYIYPNLQWAWNNINWSTTTTGLQLNINL